MHLLIANPPPDNVATPLGGSWIPNSRPRNVGAPLRVDEDQAAARRRRRRGRGNFGRVSHVDCPDHHAGPGTRKRVPGSANGERRGGGGSGGAGPRGAARVVDRGAPRQRPHGQQAGSVRMGGCGGFAVGCGLPVPPRTAAVRGVSKWRTRCPTAPCSNVRTSPSMSSTWTSPCWR